VGRALTSLPSRKVIMFCNP